MLTGNPLAASGRVRLSAPLRFEALPPSPTGDSDSLFAVSTSGGHTPRPDGHTPRDTTAAPSAMPEGFMEHDAPPPPRGGTSTSDAPSVGALGAILAPGSPARGEKRPLMSILLDGSFLSKEKNAGSFLSDASSSYPFLSSAGGGSPINGQIDGQFDGANGAPQSPERDAASSPPVPWVQLESNLNRGEWLQRHPEAGSPWPSWPTASQPGGGSTASTFTDMGMGEGRGVRGVGGGGGYDYAGTGAPLYPGAGPKHRGGGGGAALAGGGEGGTIGQGLQRLRPSRIRAWGGQRGGALLCSGWGKGERGTTLLGLARSRSSAISCFRRGLMVKVIVKSVI